jgi:hypothetical protein
MNIIQHTNELPHGWHKMIMCKSMEEAERERNGREAYLFKSNVIEAYYLFIPVVDDVSG